MLRYIIGKAKERRLEELEFKISLGKPLSNRFDNSFIKTYKPVLDDAPYRVFGKMRSYKKWCREALPSWLGYGL